MKKNVFTFLLILFTIVSNSQVGDFKIQEFYPIDRSHSYIGFSAKYMGYAMVRGRFEKFKGTFRYDENDISKTSFSFLIYTNSIDTDNNWRDKDLKSADWFYVEKYPNIKFTSTKIRPTDTGFEIIGNLTIKDISKEIIIKMNKASGILKDIRGDSQVIFTGETSSNRTEFGVEGKRWSAIKEGIAGVGNEIKIEISILGKQTNKSNYKGRYLNDESKPSWKLYKAISDKGLEAGLKLFDELKKDPNAKLNQYSLHNAGYLILKEGRTDLAVDVLRKNIEMFPSEKNLYDYYAEALAESGNLTEAKIYYQKSLDMDAENQNASEILRHLQ
jgi:polyisoprenoid-binding protein YceI